MPGLADFNVPAAKKYAQDELAAAATLKPVPFDKLFMPELSEQEIAEFTAAFTYNEFSWFLLALVAHLRGISAYGFLTIDQAVTADEAFVSQRLGEYLSAIARPNVLEWNALWAAVTSHATASKATAKTTAAAPLDAVIADALQALSKALSPIGMSRKRIADLRSRLDKAAPQPVSEMFARLSAGLEKLENTLINELAGVPPQAK